MTQARLAASDNTDEQKSRIKYKFVRLEHDALVRTFERTDQIIYEVARAKDVQMIDASSPLTGREELWMDHVHSTDIGSEELAKLTARHISEILRNQDSAQ